MNKLTKGIKRLALALCLATPVVSWATPTATVVWRSNLGQSYTIGGNAYALTIPSDGTKASGVLNDDGTVTVTNDWTGLSAPYFDLSAIKPTSVSVLVKFSGGITVPASGEYGAGLANVKDSDGHCLGAAIYPGRTDILAYHMIASTNLPTQVVMSGSDDAKVDSGYMLFSYSTTGGIKAYLGTSLTGLVGGQKTEYKFGGKTIASLSIGGDSGRYYNACGFKIEEVALFVDTQLTASDVADYEFPTLNIDDTATMTMTELNAKVAAFDADINYFSASPVVTLDVEPSDATKTYLQGALWNGTVLIKDVDKNNIVPSNYGNPNSTLKLSGVKGFFAKAKYANTVTPAIELEDSATEGREYGFWSYDGYGFNNYNGYPRVNTPELKGSGTYKCDKANLRVLLVADKFSAFTGNIVLSNGGVVCLETGVPTESDDSVLPGRVYLGGSVPVNYSEWTVSDGFYGTVEVAANDTANASTLFASSAWKGTVVVPQATNSTGGHIQVKIDKLGNANSVVQFNGLSSDTKDYYLNAGNSPTFNTTVDINGWVAFNNGSSNYRVTFDKVTSSNSGATLRLNFSGTLYYTINTLDKFAGTLSISGGTPLTIGTINLAATPEAGSRIVKCVSGSYIQNLASTKVAVNGVVDDTIELEQKNDGDNSGIYVKLPSVASIGEGEDIVYYTSLTGENGAIAAATPLNRVITLLADVDEAYVLSSGRLKINLNGFTWTGLAAPEGYKIVTTPMSGYTQYTVEEDLPVVARIGTVEGQNEYATVDGALFAAMPMPVGTVVYVLVPVSDWKYSTDMPAAYKPYYNWDSVARTLTRKATTNGEGNATVTAANAEAACAAVTVVPTSSEVETALGGADYGTYFQKTAENNGDGTWTVTVTLSKAQIFEGDASETATVTATLTGVLDDTADEVTLPAKNGLYYSFKSGDEVTDMTEGDRVLATGGTVTLDKVPGDTFYQVLVNTTPNSGTND